MRSLGPELWRLTEAASHARTAWRDGTIIACAGIAEVWTGRAVSWMLLSSAVDRHDMLWLFREGRKWLAAQTFRRIECVVRYDFRPGHRLARMLGYDKEAVMRCYDPLGRDHVLYARIHKEPHGRL